MLVDRHPSTRAARRTGAALGALALAVALLVLPGLGTPASAADPCGPTGNKVACENTRPGTPGWDIDGAGDLSIQGFATDISVNVGQRVDLKIDTDALGYRVEIFRVGYYQGVGARRVDTVLPSVTLPQTQPECYDEKATELYDCGNWKVSASWTVPSTAVSGVYVAKLIRTDTGGASHVVFVVRDDASTSAIVFQTSDPTWQAYNSYGGSDFYQGGANGRAYKISYNRPVLTRGTASGRDFFFANEYPMVRFLERNGYDTSYIAGVDSDRRGHLIRNHDVFLSVGHDEYWSGAQRANVEAARAAGVHLQFLSGNEVYWRTRYEPSSDASHTPYRTLVSYKETWAHGKLDPSPQWTGTWRDPRFAPQSQGGGLPENGLTGTAYMSNYSDLPLTVTPAEGRLRLWRHTTLTTASAPVQLAPHTVGYESNEDLDNGHRPPGLIRLSTTTGPVPEYLQDFGTQVAPGTTTHHLTLYRAPSGALVFSAGSVQWTWGLDEEHDSAYPSEPADRRMQQAQVNLFADMGVQPATLQSTLVAAAPSSDTAGPTVTITSPAAGATQSNGDRVTVSGTASDVGGGRVAGVEVSTDGGSSWHRATGTTTWSHTFVQHGRGSTPVRVRAIDDSVNIGPAASRSFQVSCPCSIFGQDEPATPATDDRSPLELGTRFTPAVDGFVTGVRFYKGSGNTGTHVGTLWGPAGERLARVSFTDETAGGWQRASFTPAVAVTAGQGYTVSYTAPVGRYASESGAFYTRGHDAGVLSVAGGFGTAPAGVYGLAGTLPTLSYQRSNYFVDVTFSANDDMPLTMRGQSPAPGAVAVPVDTVVQATYSRALVPGTARLVLRDSTGQTVAGATTYDAATRTIRFTPADPLPHFVTHQVTVTGTDTGGGAVESGGAWSFRTARPTNPPGVCPCSLFPEVTEPTLLEDADTVPVTLGVRFTSDVRGVVTGMRFYRGPGNAGPHTGTLWGPGGAELATGTFSAQGGTGWQQLDFPAPVSIAKDTTYTVSYRAPAGRYSATPNAFGAQDLSAPPLRVTPYSGAYTYGGGFPDSSSPTSYLVDVIFERTPPGIALDRQQPAPGAVDVARGSKVVVAFTNTLAPGYSLVVRQGATTLPGTTALDPAGSTLTWTPAQPLPADAEVTVTLAGVVSTDGASLPTQTWSFRTRAAETLDSQSLFGDEVPDDTASDDAAAIELGTAFTPTRDGFVKAVRFFKGPGNGGTHTGSVWTEGGGRLATVTFTDETATGWQTATLPEPLPVRAGTTYVVSYLAPQGRYATSPGFFSAPWARGDLVAPATGNGRYVYGGGFPQFSHGATNYFADVVFARATAALTVAGRTPEPGATGVALGTQPSLGVSAALAPGASAQLRAGTTPVAGTLQRSSDGRRLTFQPAAALAPETDHTVTFTGLVSTEGAALPDQTWTFRTGPDEGGAVSLFTGEVPPVPAQDDASTVELGTVFSPAVDGEVTAVRFYKGAGNGGTHTGSVWSVGGARLGTVTFTDESATGWQTAVLPTPVPVTAGQQYVVSYLAPQGRYAVAPGYFDAPHVSGALSAPAGQNGRYRYGGGFPEDSYGSTNYYADVVFRPSSTPTGAQE